MKKIISIAVLLLSIQTCFAQVSYGVQADAILSFGRSKTNPARSAGLLFEKGGFFSYVPLNQKLSLMPQLNLLIKGSQWTYISNLDYYQYRDILTYLEMPIYLIYKDSKHNNEGFFGGAGPVLSYGLRVI